MQTLRYTFGLVVAGGLIVLAHWLPWPRQPRGLGLYGVTVGSILLGLMVWVGPTSAWVAVAGFALAGAVGMAVPTCYDRIMNWRVRAGLYRPEAPLDARRTKDGFR